MNAVLSSFVNALIAGTGVAAAVWLLLSATPRRALNAATRYALWWVTLAIVVMLPLFYLPTRAEHRAGPVADSQPADAAQVMNISEPAPSPAPAFAPPTSRFPRFPLEFAAGSWPVYIFGLWGAAAALMMIRLCLSYIALERRKRRAQPARGLEFWPVRALLTSEVASPMAAGLFRPAILLPERLFAELDAAELDQIRVHEMAHLLRRDDIALLIQRTLEALFVLHPVVRWITRRIDLEREIACDDFVVEQTGQARLYASCLTRVVELAGGMRSSIVASAATEERSHLARRIEMLLDKTRHKGTRLLKTRLLAIACGMLALACVAVRTPAFIAFAAAAPDSFIEPPPLEQPPAAPETPAPPAMPQGEPRNSRTMTSRTTDGMHSRELKVHGDVQFTEDETDVKGMSPGGLFSYEEVYGFNSRRYQATADSSGQIVRRYLIDGREKPVDADAKAWLRAAIPDLLRESGIDAPERVRRILKQGGLGAVLAEIAKIHSDGTKKIYICELIPAANLTSDQFQTVLRIVRGIGSDGEKAALLVFLAPNAMKDNLRDYTFEALKTIHSDGEKRRVLTRFLRDGSRPTLILCARAVSDINSDGEKAAVLVDLASYLHGNDDMSRSFFRAARTIHSDGERARVLMAVMASAGEQHDTLVEALRAAEPMNSDGEKARVLVHADGYWKDDDLLRRAYFETAASVHSDGEKARVLTSLVGRPGLSNRTFIEAVRCAAGIHSDGEKAHVLVAIASHSNGKSEVREEIKTAAVSIHSDGEYRRVMAALDLRAGNVPNRPQAR